jgi:3-(3-hydroxy-phenyl)propionate hydroxylase
MHRVQVLVCGAGPVGATAAYILAERGIDVCLVEALGEPAEDMRASTLHPPTLDMMEELGLLATLEAQGLKAPVYQYRNRRSGEVLAFDLGELADELRHPYRLQCEQFKLARLCSSLVAEHPHGEVRFRRRVLSFTQDATGVTVNLEAPLAIETVRADYVIGADGANSVVRKWLGVPFEGFTYPEKFLTLSTEWPMERALPNIALVNYMADSEEWCVLLRTPAAWRVLVPASESDPDEVLLADAKKTAVFDGLMGDGAAVETRHRTIYRVHQRVVTRYDHGRVLLIGDAAHLNNPLGGFGMNSGIHDAWNLTEKLTAILQGGKAAEPLLAQFDRQRRTIMTEFVQAQTIKNKKAMEGSQRAHQAELERILKDPVARREYLRTQAMVRSLQREAELA